MSANKVMHQMATHLLAEMPVLVSERAHHVGVADLLQPKTVSEVGREGLREWLGNTDSVVLVEAKGEGDATVPRTTNATHWPCLLVVLRRSEAVVCRRQPIVCKGYLPLLNRVGHLGELICKTLGRRDVVVPSEAAALAEMRVGRIRGFSTALRRMLGLVMQHVLSLVENRVFVHLPHLEVVDFLHHWLPKTNPCINKPV
jgi:hypothetical protein